MGFSLSQWLLPDLHILYLLGTWRILMNVIGYSKRNIVVLMLATPVLDHLLDFAQTHVHWVSDAIQPSHPLSSLFLLPWIFPSIRVFSNGSALLIRWRKYWSFNFSISPSSEYLGLISFRIDWFDLLSVQGTLKSLLQYHSLKTSILWH